MPTLGDLDQTQQTAARLIDVPGSAVVGHGGRSAAWAHGGEMRHQQALDNARDATPASPANPRVYSPARSNAFEVAEEGGYDGMFAVSDAGSGLGLDGHIATAHEVRRADVIAPSANTVEVVERDFDSANPHPRLITMEGLDAERARLDEMSRVAKGREEKKRAKEERSESEARNAAARRTLEEKQRASAAAAARESAAARDLARTLEQNARDARVARERATEAMLTPPAKKGLFGGRNRPEKAVAPPDAAREQEVIDRARVAEAERLVEEHAKGNSRADRMKARAAIKEERENTRRAAAERKQADREAKAKEAAGRSGAIKTKRGRHSRPAPAPAESVQEFKPGAQPVAPQSQAPTVQRATLIPAGRMFAPVFPEGTPPVALPDKARPLTRRERREPPAPLSEADQGILDGANRARALKEIDESITNEKIEQAQHIYDESIKAIQAGAKRRALEREQNGIDLPQKERSRLRKSSLVRAGGVGAACLLAGVAVGAVQSGSLAEINPFNASADSAPVPFLVGGDGAALRISEAWADDKCGVAVLMSTLGPAAGGEPTMKIGSLTYHVNGKSVLPAPADRPGCVYTTALPATLAENVLIYLAGIPEGELSAVTVGLQGQVTEWQATEGPAVQSGITD